MGLHCIGKARKKVSLLQEKLKRETVVMEEKEKVRMDYVLYVSTHMSIDVLYMYVYVCIYVCLYVCTCIYLCMDVHVYM